MLYIAFNYHDPRIQLRLGALLAVAVMVVCLGIVQLSRPLGLRAKLLLAVAFILGCLILGYALTQLKAA